jgi:hypothetical protein
MTGWVGAELGLSPLDAYQLVTQIVESPVANVVDTVYTMTAKVAKKYLPGVTAYGGMHQRLRTRAKALAGST